MRYIVIVFLSSTLGERYGSEVLRACAVKPCSAATADSQSDK